MRVCRREGAWAGKSRSGTYAELWKTTGRLQLLRIIATYSESSRVWIVVPDTREIQRNLQDVSRTVYDLASGAACLVGRLPRAEYCVEWKSPMASRITNRAGPQTLSLRLASAHVRHSKGKPISPNRCRRQPVKLRVSYFALLAGFAYRLQVLTLHRSRTS